MTQHAEYSPSRLKEIFACPGVVQLRRLARKKNKLVESQSEAALHGTMLHEIMESILQAHGRMTIPPKDSLVQAATESLEVEDRLLIKEALEYFYKVLSDYSEDEILGWDLEKRVYLGEFGFPQVEGTTDVIVVVAPKPGPAKILVFDWKFGRNKVDAYKNHQLRAYGHGFALQAFPKDISLCTAIDVHIVQPKIENYQCWETGLEETWLNELHVYIEDAESQNPTFCPSDDNCKWCDCKSFCDARLKQVQENAQKVFAILAQKPEIWDEADVQFLLGQLLELKSVAKGILDDYQARLKEGKKVPGFKLVRGQGRRAWVDFDEVIEYFDDNHPEVEVFEVKPKSPAKLEKEIPLADRRSPEFQNLIKKIHGVKMVQDKEGGEEIKRGAEAAQEAFKEFKQV